MSDRYWQTMLEGKMQKLVQHSSTTATRFFPPSPGTSTNDYEIRAAEPTRCVSPPPGSSSESENLEGEISNDAAQLMPPKNCQEPYLQYVLPTVTWVKQRPVT
jgi:hypothetical protein